MNRIVYKVDDCLSDEFGTNKDVVKSFWRFIEIVKNIKVSIGIIGRSINIIPPTVLIQIKKGIFRGNIELYNHGYEHVRDGVPICSKDDAERNQEAIERVFGVVPKVYGAPMNAADRIPGLAMTFYGGDIPISGYHELELWDGHEKFVRTEDYKPPKDGETKVYQMHPWVWSEKDFADFESILKRQKENGAEWIFPTEL